MLQEANPLCGLSLEHNPQVGFCMAAGRGEFGEELEHKCLFADSKLLRLEVFFFSFFFSFPEPATGTCTCKRFGMTWHLTLQSLSRSTRWAASCLWPVTPAKRTRGETPPFSTPSAVPAHTGGLPECQGRVTMATSHPSTMELSTGELGLVSVDVVVLVYWIKWLQRAENTKASKAQCSAFNLFTVCCMWGFVEVGDNRIRYGVCLLCQMMKILWIWFVWYLMTGCRPQSARG